MEKFLIWMGTLACMFVAGRYMLPSSARMIKLPTRRMTKFFNSEYQAGREDADAEFLIANPFCNSCRSYHPEDSLMWRPCYQKPRVAEFAADVIGQQFKDDEPGGGTQVLPVPPAPIMAVQGEEPVGFHTEQIEIVHERDPRNPAVVSSETRRNVVGSRLYSDLVALDDAANVTRQMQFAAVRAVGNRPVDMSFWGQEDEGSPVGNIMVMEELVPVQEGHDWGVFERIDALTDGIVHLTGVLDRAPADSCSLEVKCNMDDNCPFVSACRIFGKPENELRRSGWLRDAIARHEREIAAAKVDGMQWLVNFQARTDEMAEELLQNATG